MGIETSTSTTASPDQVWAVLLDVAAWPSWTRSITAVRRLDDGPLRVGSRVRVSQPGTPAMTYVVSELSRPSEFTWYAALPGVRTVARHRLIPEAGGGTHIILDVEHLGPLARAVSAVTSRRTRRYVDLEVAGLKAASEAAAAQPSE
jgi:uncharacterized protein YndB with AHSA1/START domain